MRNRILLLFTLLTLLLTGCVEPLSEGSGATGTLTLEFGSGQFSVATKADTETPTTQNGDRFTSLLVVITNKTGNVVDSYSESFDSMQEKRVVSFEHLPVGNYHAYAYANTGHKAWLEDGSTIDVNHFDPEQLLKALTGESDTPQAPGASTGMLLTGHKSFSVGVQQNTGRVELQRPVARFNVWVYNHTGFPITLDALSFSDFNADQGYLLQHLDASGLPAIPANTNHRPLPPYDLSNGSVPAASGVSEPGERRVYQQLLYENKGTDAYRMYASVTLHTDHGNVQKDLVTDGVELVPFSRIHDMQADDTVNVLLVCPNTTDGAFYGWNTLDYNPALHKVTAYPAALSYEAFYQQYASDVLRLVESAYYTLTLKRTQNGYRLLKKDSEESIFGGIDGIPSEVSVVEANLPTNTTYPISSEFGGHLVHFTYQNPNDNNKDYIVYAFTDKKKNYTLATQQKTANNMKMGDHMFALYEINPEGSRLKLIDNETHQVTPLTYMARNWNLDVVLNIYYGVDDVEINFRVENKYWSGSDQSTSEYTFR